ncbi:MAG: efflux RND transporter periplasmic adaptor subunit, partial [Xanthobacteraceae bacterium]
VRVELSNPETAISIPSSALIFDKNGLRVATVGPDNRVILKAVTIARDLGTDIEIGSGLLSDDRVVASPPDGIISGDQVRIAAAPKPPVAGATASAK